MRRLLLCLLLALAADRSARLHAALPATGNFARTNLVAWCIVPFDSQKRGPEERAAMLDRLGVKRLAYDWRAEHIPSFDAEVAAMRKHGIELTAWWFPAALNDEAKAILACLERNKVHPQLWVTMGTEPEPDAAKLAAKLDGAVTTLAPICEAAAKLGCTVALYNHLGWFGEPANQVAIIAKLKAVGHTNVGSVYNFHHAHAHLADFAEQFRILQPHLLALNLNGMVRDGDKAGKKIIPLGTGDEELRLLQLVNASGWRGPIGIIGHTEEDAEVKLRKELDGLEMLAPLVGPGPAPVAVPRTPPSAGAPNVRSAGAPSRAEQILDASDGLFAFGKLGRALDARVQGLTFDGQPGFRQPPLTVEACVSLSSADSFNILAASEAKASPTHWELYTYAGGGDLSFYSPGNSPAEVRSGFNVCDGRWHHVAAQFSPTHVRLFVDGRQVNETRVTRTHESDGSAAQFAIGRLVEGGLGCDGFVDEVRVSQGLRAINDTDVWSCDTKKGESTTALSRGERGKITGAAATSPASDSDSAPTRSPQAGPDRPGQESKRHAATSPSPPALAGGGGRGEVGALDASKSSGTSQLGSASPSPLTAVPTVPAVGGVKPLTPAPADNARVGEPAVSGREPGVQGEKDWVDNRWQDTDVGPFLASNLRLPDGSVIAKALTIRVGERGEGAVVYDTETCTLRAAWTGGFLKFDAGRFGLIGMPKAGGEWVFSDSKVTVSEISSAPHFAGVGVGEGRVVLQYSVDGTRVLELPGLEDTSAGPVVRCVFSVDPHSKPLRLLAVADLRGQRQVSQTGEREFVVEVSDGKNSSVMVVAGLSIEALAKRGGDTEGPVALSLDAADRLLMFSVLRWQGPASKKGDFLRALTNSLRSEHLSNLQPKANSPHWPTLTTRGQRGADTDFLAVDTLTLPYDNPTKALLFASGIDFTPDGAGYVCTIHGDVWRVTGIDDSLRELKWQRYATGLFQPLGLKVRDGKVFVLGRDRITRLHDKNGDGEADFYENFFDGIATSTGGHDYVTCLETDAAGNFYYVDPLGLHRVAADGSRQETLATGFRNPNGMGVRPDGRVLTAAPQQGTWTPSSGIWEVRPDNVGLYGGYGGPKVTATRPLGYDAPLCWLPHGVDNSSGSQVWIPPGQWGPLGGQMLHLLWGRCTAMLVLRDEMGGTPPAVNGAAVPLPVKFLSGPNRATFNPKDGALYVAGSTGWQTSAVKDGALQRVRFTGKTPGLPVRWAVKPGGLELTFSRPVDPSTAADPGSYGFKQWNYRYAEQYGSKDWSVADPQKEGRDEIPVKSAKVLADGRSVFLELPGLQRVMQFELKYNVDAADGGKAIRGSLWGSINRVP